MDESFELSAEMRQRLEKALSDYPTEAGEGDYAKEVKLLRELPPRFLSAGEVSELSDYLEVIKWKSTRVAGELAERDVEKIRRVTRDAFQTAASGDALAAVTKLCDLDGVKARVASAILMFYDPDRFTVMDINAWKSLVHVGALGVFDCGWEYADDYPPYLSACLAVQRSFRHTLRDTDRALWSLASWETTD